MKLIFPYYRPYWPRLLEMLGYITIVVGYGVALARMQAALAK